MKKLTPLITTLMLFLSAPVAYAQSAPTITLGAEPIKGTGDFQTGSIDTYKLINGFISTIIGVVTVVAGLAFLLYFAVGGLKWITSSGEKARAEEAKTELTQAAIGLIVVAVSYFIVGIVGGVVGIDILNPLKVLKLQ